VKEQEEWKEEKKIIASTAARVYAEACPKNRELMIPC
jgi:hypothetical protein